MLATLPAGLREYASRVSDRFHLDAPGWFHRPEEVGELATVASAVADARRLRVRYGRRDRTVERELEPLGLVRRLLDKCADRARRWMGGRI